MKQTKPKAYVIAFGSVLLTSLLSSYFTNRTIRSRWYQCVKPTITPPGYVFPIVWTILYIFVALAFSRSAHNKWMTQLFIINLLLNIVWCWLYFSSRQIVISILPILGIWTTAFLIIYHSEDRYVKYLMTPYLLWISFATLLNLLSIQRETTCARQL